MSLTSSYPVQYYLSIQKNTNNEEDEGWQQQKTLYRIWRFSFNGCRYDYNELPLIDLSM